MCRASKSSRADNPIGIWAKDPRQHRTREMHENIRLLTAGEATAAHHHLPYQRKTAGQTGTVIPKECVASQPHFRIGSGRHGFTCPHGVRMYSLSPHATPMWSQNTHHNPHKSCPGVRMSSQSHRPNMFYLKVRTFPPC